MQIEEKNKIESDPAPTPIPVAAEADTAQADNGGLQKISETFSGAGRRKKSEFFLATRVADYY